MDVEGDPVLFDGVKTGSVNYTFSVNSQSGAVVVTPPTGFVGTMQVLLRVRPAGSSDTNDLYDSQLATIIVAPDAPTAVDLLASSDSGAHNDDDLTRSTSLSFQVNGVSDGAIVRLHLGETVIGQVTASGTSATITTSGLATATDGTYSVFATQLVNGVESPVSPSLGVTIDRTAPPAFTSTPPTEAMINQLLSYDAENPLEGTADTVYSLTGAPAGVSIDPATGLMTWTPSSSELGPNAFSIVIADAAGNTRSQDLSINVTTDSTVLFRLEVVGASDTPISSIDVGGLFQVNVYVEDLRAEPEGVWAAFLDLVYNQQLVALTGPLTYGSSYPNQPIGNLSTPGLIDEAGALAGLSPLGGGEFLLLSVPMRATNAGTATFEANPADNLPSNEILLFGLDESVPVDDVGYGSVVLTVEPAFAANDDLKNVDEDSTGTPLDLLSNDEVFEGSPGNLIIVNVTTPTQGGTLDIAADGKSVNYAPAPNFFGEDTFFYMVSDGTGTKSAQVTVQVAPVNDDPVAVDDTFTVAEDSANVSLDVLHNDLITPDVE